MYIIKEILILQKMVPLPLTNISWGGIRLLPPPPLHNYVTVYDGVWWKLLRSCLSRVVKDFHFVYKIKIRQTQIPPFCLDFGRFYVTICIVCSPLERIAFIPHFINIQRFVLLAYPVGDKIKLLLLPQKCQGGEGASAFPRNYITARTCTPGSV